MFPSADIQRPLRSPASRRSPAAPARPAASPSLLRRVAGTLRAFAMLEDPELEARVAREAAVLRAHHRRPAAGTSRVARVRRRGAVRAATQPCRSPLPR
jgi:hypothetical protein